MKAPKVSPKQPDQQHEDTQEADMQEALVFSYELKIPKERVGVVIGKEGIIKTEIEEATHCTLAIDSAEGDVTLRGSDSITIMTAMDIVKAIGRGFNPEVALRLLKSDYTLEIISLSDYAGKTPKKMARLKGRVIGEGGKARKLIEELTETNMSVYGKTIALIGVQEDVKNARAATEMLLTGSPHAKVYLWLEKKRRERKAAQMQEAFLPSTA